MEVQIQEVIGLVALIIFTIMIYHHVRAMKKQGKEFLERLEKK